MLSYLGQNVLAASALIFSIRISILITCSSILFSLSILIGHAYGEKDYSRIGSFMQQGWILGLIISIPVMIFFWKIDSILLYLKQSESLAKIVQEFFYANIWNVLPFMLAVCNQQLCYGVRKQKIDLVANIGGVVILLVSAYILIFGKSGFPALGVKGLGYALDLQAWFYFLLTSAIIFSNHFFKQFELLSIHLNQRLTNFIKMFQIGWPIAIQIGGEMLSTFAYAAMVGWLGEASLAAYQVITQYFFLIMVPIFALSQASGVLIGVAKGEKNEDKIKLIGHIGMTMSLIITIFIACLYFLVPKFLASFYLNVNNIVNQEIVHYIILLFAIFAVLQVFDGVRNVLTGSLRGLFDTRYPMLIGIVVIWLIGIPCSYLLGFHFHLGVTGIGLGSTIGVLIGMAILLHRWKYSESNFKI